MRKVMFATLLASLPALGAQANGGESTEARARRVGERCWQDVRVLADDSMEGRRAGTPGHRRAAEFVAAEFRKAGLRPEAGNGFLQPVVLESRQIVEENSRLILQIDGIERTLVLGEDAFFNLRGNFVPTLDAPLVFVGHGLKLPQYGVDDLAGLDLAGKVVVTFTSAPTRVPGAAGAHFSSMVERWKLYRDLGAVGMVGIPNPHNMDLPWERMARARFETFMALKGAGQDPYSGMKVGVQFNPAHLDKLLEGTDHRAADLLATLESGESLPHFELAARIHTVIDARVTTATSENVAGVLRGSDPGVRDEFVVLSAHLDHLGVASEGEGDRLFNGAMDNASGVAVLMQAARELGRRKAPRRSIIFLAVTAEEMGLLGSRAYVARSLAAKRRIVANLNTDMFLPLFPMKQLLVFGLEESDLGDDARAVAGELGIRVQADPQPLRNRFIRSDQYSFIRVGIPSLATKVGFDAGSPEAEIDRNWFAERYHATGDSIDQPVDLEAVGLYEETIRRLAVRIANRPRVPRWNESSVFAGLAAR